MTGRQRDGPQPATRPANGWLSVERGVIGIHRTPPASETVRVALQAAVLTANAQPSDVLLDWFATRRHVPLTWDKADTAALVRLLRAHEPASWHLLEVTGVLERALPEIATAVRRRQADVDTSDALGAFRFRVAERLDDLAIETGHPSDDLVLAGLVSDVCRDAVAPQPCWTKLLDRLLPAADARRIAAIVSDARLLRASADDPRGFEERDVLQLATHLGSTTHARDAYQLALALGALTTRRRDALAERRVLIDGVLDEPTGPAAARRLTAQRIATDDAVIERLRFAPISYVLSHTSEELVGQARLIDPLPNSGCVRVAVTAEGEANHWKIAVACRDANALLAHLTEVLTRHRFDIIDATIGTWPDGAVLDTFVVSSTDEPNAPELANDFEESLRRRLRAPVGVGLIVEFNNEVLPWHTVCDVTGPDQPGALLAISAGFARAKVMVYSARIATADHAIQDRFTISDRRGRKLDDSSIERVRRALSGGAR
ncbi:MAG: hypothetical protein ACXV8L_14970 [Ilumatobacteraceae bacterium]